MGLKTEYKVRVFDDGSFRWTLNGETHCAHGPAVYNHNGDDQEWWLNDIEYSFADWDKTINPPKVVTRAEIEKLIGFKFIIADEERDDHKKGK